MLNNAKQLRREIHEVFYFLEELEGICRIYLLNVDFTVKQDVKLIMTIYNIIFSVV
jgi:hypothetical protein